MRYLLPIAILTILTACKPIPAKQESLTPKITGDRTVLDIGVSGVPNPTIIVPPGYKVIRRQQDDFTLFYMQGSETPPSLGFYFGHAPSSFAPPDATRVLEKGSLVGEWLEWRHPESGLISREAFLDEFFVKRVRIDDNWKWTLEGKVPGIQTLPPPSPPDPRELTIHLFLHGYSDSDVRLLTAIANTLTAPPSLPPEDEVPR